MPCAMPYGKAVLVAFDQLCNSALRGWPDETLSSRAYRMSRDNKRHWPRKIIDSLFFWDQDKKTGKRHCELSFETEREGRQLPPECRVMTKAAKKDISAA